MEKISRVRERVVLELKISLSPKIEKIFIIHGTKIVVICLWFTLYENKAIRTCTDILVSIRDLKCNKSFSGNISQW